MSGLERFKQRLVEQTAKDMSSVSVQDTPSNIAPSDVATIEQLSFADRSGVPVGATPIPQLSFPNGTAKFHFRCGPCNFSIS